MHLTPEFTIDFVGIGGQKWKRPGGSYISTWEFDVISDDIKLPIDTQNIPLSSPIHVFVSILVYKREFL